MSNLDLYTHLQTQSHRQYVHTTTGKVIYDPMRDGMKRNTQRWVIVQLTRGDDLIDYYRDMMRKRFHVSLHRPSWGAHVSVVRGDVILPQYAPLWKKHDGEKVEIQYTHDLFWNEEHVWLNAHIELAPSIRRELGLPVKYGLHITVGKFADHHIGYLPNHIRGS